VGKRRDDKRRTGKQASGRKEAEQPPVPPAASGPAAPAPAADPREALQALIGQANAGDRAALARLGRFLDVNPALWEKAGDLTALAERAWVGLIAGGDALLAESARRKLRQFKGALAGAHPTPLEQLLVGQVGVCWLAAQHGELQAAGPAGGSLQQAAFRLKRAESAQRRLQGAVKTLATLRALLPEGLVPANHLQLHEPVRQTA
jgi:hypothetical protein